MNLPLQLSQAVQVLIQLYESNLINWNVKQLDHSKIVTTNLCMNIDWEIMVMAFKYSTAVRILSCKLLSDARSFLCRSPCCTSCGTGSVVSNVCLSCRYNSACRTDVQSQDCIFGFSTIIMHSKQSLLCVTGNWIERSRITGCLK